MTADMLRCGTAATDRPPGPPAGLATDETPVARLDVGHGFRAVFFRNAGDWYYRFAGEAYGRGPLRDLGAAREAARARAYEQAGGHTGDLFSLLA